MFFVGREQEISGLERQFARRQFEFSVIYGRRRIGKTWLIRKFIEGKPAIYFTGIEAGAATNLESMSRVVHQHAGQAGLSPFQSFADLFVFLAEYAKSRQLVFVIDEYPYLAAAAPEVSSILQRFCDQEWKETQLHLILCGSSMSFMERQVLGIQSPLYGRRTAQYHIKPFSWFETEVFLQPMAKEDAAVLHCATGGVAEYLSYVDTRAKLEENLTSLFLDSSGRLFEEPSNLLKQELREPRIYNDILDAIANGASRSNEIATKTHLQTGALNRYLDALCDLGIISREKPMLNPQSRKTLYRISDGCFRFWYRFVMPNLNAIMSGLGSQVCRRLVLPAIPGFMGQGFELIFFDYFDRWNARGELPDLATDRGRWWGGNPDERREEEIDLLATGLQVTFFGEAKWRTEKVDADTIRDLERKSRLIEAKERTYILFSKTGFTRDAEQYAQGRKDIRLETFLEFASREAG